MLKENVKNRIIAEYGNYFTENQKKEVVDLYEKVIDMEVDHPSIQGVSKNLSWALEQFFELGYPGALNDSQMNVLVNSFINIEPFLKKLLYIIDSAAYESIYSKELTCGFVMDKLGLVNPLKSPSGHINFQARPEEYIGHDNNKLEHILRAYQIRNTSAHDAKAWTTIEKLVNAQSVIITSLYACWKYRDAIERAFDRAEKKVQLDVENYAKNIKRSYEKSIRNGFKFIPIKWQKRDSSGFSNNNNFSTETYQEKVEMTTLREGNGVGKRLLLLGEAGCGKTTSLQYLEYLDAINWLKDRNNPIPVMVRLIHAVVEWFNLEDYICKVLDIPLDYCTKLLSAGAINIYLDGVNEIIASREVKRKVVMTIEKFLLDYPKTFVAITDRENAEIKISTPMLTYYLHSMEREDIKSYLFEKRTMDEENMQTLLDYTDSMTEQGIAFTPILLNFLLTFIERKGSLPVTSTEFIQQYLSSLLERELHEKKDINASPGRLDSLLMYLSIHANEDSRLSDISILKLFADCKYLLGQTDIDTKQCLDLALQLGILENKENHIWFSNSAYYECFFAKALEKGMDEWDA